VMLRFIYILIIIIYITITKNFNKFNELVNLVIVNVIEYLSSYVPINV
jgi:hypothetical protein